MKFMDFGFANMNKKKTFYSSTSMWKFFSAELSDNSAKSSSNFDDEESSNHKFISAVREPKWSANLKPAPSASPLN